MKIEIENGTAEERGGVIQKGERRGESWSMRNQVGWLYNGGKYPAKVQITLDKDQPAYAPGFYTFAPESFEAGEYDRLQFARTVKLVPLPVKG